MELSDIPEPYRSGQSASTHNRDTLMASRFVGCYFCLLIYSPRSIKKWIDDGRTAMCPICDVDAVIPITPEQFDSDYLMEMNRYWFVLPSQELPVTDAWWRKGPVSIDKGEERHECDQSEGDTYS